MVQVVAPGRGADGAATAAAGGRGAMDVAVYGSRAAAGGAGDVEAAR